MNPETQRLINEAMRQVDRSYNVKPNVVKLNRKNGLEHELAKTKLMFLTKQAGKTGYSEVIFKKVNGKSGRADHFIPEDSLIIEVLNTEKEKDAVKKEGYYPPEFLIYYYTVKEIAAEGFMI